MDISYDYVIFSETDFDICSKLFVWVSIFYQNNEPEY